MDVKTKVYKALIQPIMEYASTVWLPYYAKNIAKVESVQRRMAHFIFNDYRPQCSVTSLLEKLQWPALYKRRECNRLLMFFKIIHSYVDIPMQPSIFMLNVSNTRGNAFRFIQLQPCIDCYAKSFFQSKLSYGIHYQTQLFLVNRMLQ